jgi:hypothetical protein
MCDYSLTGVASRPARVADALVSVAFWQGSTTRGFAAVNDHTVAVCLRPGTEIAFANDVRIRGIFFRKTLHQRLARFRKVDIDRPDRHHDALEFANGSVVLLNDLVPGQHAVVLQLPADRRGHGHTTEQVAPARRAAEMAPS